MEQSAHLPRGTSGLAESHMSARDGNSLDPSGCHTRDWDDIVGLGVDFDVLASSMDYTGLLSETTEAGGTRVSKVSGTTQENLFEIPRDALISSPPVSGVPSYASQASLIGSCSSLALPSSNTQSLCWDGLESLGIDVYPTDQGISQFFTGACDLVTQIE